MSAPAIRVEKLSKRYQIGAAQQQHTSLREAISAVVKTPLSRLRQLSGRDATKNTFWALHDVSLEIPRGEVVGIIGHNGAGKSTLLRVLSQITEPTAGRVEIRGRVGSLLEVGTGFHPELTGRENIYLNGAMLGMSRREIRGRFAEIVAFAEMEQFLDTPVKRYSSGMYMRLAFAVAAHLEPEILIVDEVLAVGDSDFQRRCLGRMEAIATNGRTILFVSHNLAAIERLCDRTTVLQTGRVVFSGPTHEALRLYHQSITSAESSGHSAHFDVAPEKTRRPLVIQSARITSNGRFLQAGYAAGEPLEFELGCMSIKADARPVCGIGIDDSQGRRVVTLHTHATSGSHRSLPEGDFRLRCQIADLKLIPGTYHVKLSLEDLGVPSHVVERALCLTIACAGHNTRANQYNRGVVFCDQQWELTNK